MKIIHILSLLCFIVFAQTLKAQPPANDTARAALRNERLRAMKARRAEMMQPGPGYKGLVARAARRAARRFVLTKEQLLQLRAGQIPAGSDVFKPTSAANPALLTDSAYVKTYRYDAFNNAQRQMLHPAGTGLLIGGGVLVFVSLMLVLILAVFSHSKG